jgi:hypothetical protein
MFLVGAILGVLGFLLTVFIVDRQSVQRKLHEKRNRDPNAENPIVLEAATIADDLVPLATPQIGPGSIVKILGFDGFYLASKNGPVLSTGFDAWMKAGAQIRYLLLGSPDEVSRNRLKQIRDRYPNNFFPIEIPSTERGPGRDDESKCERYQTFHPTLFSNGDRRAMWVERLHNPHSEFAYNVKFVSPLAMAAPDERAEFDKYNHDFDELAAIARPLA